MEDTLSNKVRDFLNFIPEDDVIQLAKTSTSGLLQACNREEAAGIIVRYSDAVTLLSRRKIKISYIVEYLNSQRVPFSLPSTKATLTRKLLQYWGIQGTESYNFEDEEEVGPKGRVRHDSQVNEPNRINAITPEADSFVNIQHIPEQIYPTQDATGQSLAYQFVPWFYNILNTLENFQPNHFWPKCCFRMEIIGLAPDVIVKEVNTGDDVFNLFHHLVQVEQVRFNPNTINGVGIRGRITPHGLVEIVACGTVHRSVAEFGRFEQMFTLLRDPQYQNNFKIMNTILRLRSTAHCNQFPNLTS